MLLYLLRHANADTQASSDDARPLSEKGREQAEVVAHFCKAQELQLSVVLASPLPRARQTAEIVCKTVDAELLICPWLASGMEPETALDELRTYRQRGSVMLVGHEPDFSEFAAHLLGLPTPTAISIRKASLTLFELDLLRGGAIRLQFSMPCRLMRRHA
jgi:phosphohistidine phosphatase